MPVILQGDRSGAAKYLTYAKSRLAFLKGLLDAPFSHTTGAGRALIRLTSTDDDNDTILIRVAGDEFFAYGHGEIWSSKYVTAGVFNGIDFRTSPESPTFVDGPHSLGGGLSFYLATEDTDTTGWEYFSPNGISLTRIVEGGVQVYNNTAYIGVARDGDGKVIGKEIMTLGFEADGGGGGVTEAFAVIGRVAPLSFVGDFPFDLLALLGIGGSIEVDASFGPLFCGGKTVLATLLLGGSGAWVIFRSTDAGRTWTLAFDGRELTEVFPFGPPFLMDDQGVIGLFMLDTTDLPYQVRIWRSTDRGATFAAWQDPPPSLQTIMVAQRFGILNLGAGAFLLITTLRVGVENIRCWTRLARTLDYGETWDVFDEEFPGTDLTSFTFSMRVYQTVKEAEAEQPDPTKAKIVVPVFRAGDGYFCYVSQDGGATWHDGPRIDPSTAPPALDSHPPFFVEHLGNRSRPQAASIAFPHLYDNPV